MIYLKTYKQLNEGLRDKMLPKPKKDIRKNLESLSNLELKDKFLDVFFSDNYFNAYEKLFSFQDFIDYIEDIIGRNIYQELIDDYKDIYDEDDLDYLKNEIGEEDLIIKTNFSKEELIKLILKTLDEIDYDYMFEGLRDKMKPKSDEDILTSLDNLSDDEKIISVLFNNLSFDYLPRDNKGLCTFDGDLDLSFHIHKIDKLPNDFTVNGNLNCSTCGLKELPTNLTVNGDLKVHSNNLTELPNRLIVNGDMDCSFNKITKLPEDLIVTGTLDVRYVPLDGIEEKFGYLIPTDFKKPEGVKRIVYQ